MRFAKLKSKFGIDRVAYGKMLIEQNGVCAICKTPSVDYLCVDHNHKTNKVRSLLCNGCNTAIGMMRENVAIFESAIQYLKKYENA
jgi:formate dehydrogenase maturation protein FdhE